MVMARLAQVPMFASDNEKALNMLTSRCVHPVLHSTWVLNVRGRKEVMLAFLALIDDKYGGVEAYLREYVGLGEEDLETIRRNILVPRARE